MYVVLVYDINKENNGQKRWNHIFKICGHSFNRYMVECEF